MGRDAENMETLRSPERAMPQRIQRKRIKGWRMPPGAVYVGRPTIWGNPWRVVDCGRHGIVVQDSVRNWYPSSHAVGHRFAVVQFRRWLNRSDFAKRLLRVETLRGRDLACWCPLDRPCHADVLLELANQ